MTGGAGSSPRRGRAQVARGAGVERLGTALGVVLLALLYLGVVAMIFPGVMQLGGRIVCPPGTRFVALVEHGVGSGPKRGKAYEMLCLDAEGIGQRHGQAVAWLALYGVALGCAAATIALGRRRSRGAVAPPEGAT